MQIKDILETNNVPYTEKGKSLLVRCLNPEHEDKNPSLHIDKVLGIGHCFSCGFKVDIHKHFGIVKNAASIKVRQLQEKLLSIYRNESQHFPRGYNQITKAYRGISAGTLLEFKAFTCELSSWEGRVWFPIYDIFGTLVCFQGRYIASELHPKYIFYPAHITPPLFLSRPDCSNGTLIVVEGIFDMLRLWDSGIKNVICSFGVSLSHKYSNSLDPYKIMGITTIIPLYDNDKAGNKAIRTFEELYKDDFIIRKYSLPIGKDPGDLSNEEILELKSFI